MIAVLVDTVASEIYQSLLVYGMEEKKIARINMKNQEFMGSKEWNLLFGE